MTSSLNANEATSRNLIKFNSSDQAICVVRWPRCKYVHDETVFCGHHNPLEVFFLSGQGKWLDPADHGSLRLVMVDVCRAYSS